MFNSTQLKSSVNRLPNPLWSSLFVDRIPAQRKHGGSRKGHLRNDKRDKRLKSDIQSNIVLCNSEIQLISLPLNVHIEILSIIFSSIQICTGCIYFYICISSIFLVSHQVRMSNVSPALMCFHVRATTVTLRVTSAIQWILQNNIFFNSSCLKHVSDHHVCTNDLVSA